MRRHFLSTLLLILSCQAAFAQQKTGRERAGLFGPVRTVSGDEVVRFNHPREGEPNPTKPTPLNTVTYNERGDEVVRLVPYSEDGRLVWTWKHDYDAAGRRTESRLTDEEDWLVGKEVYKYDSGSRLVEKLTIQTTAPGPIKETYSYDPAGRLVEIAGNYWGKRGNRRVYTYDAKGRLAAVATYDPKGKPSISSKAIEPFGLCRGGHKVAFGYGEGTIPVELRCYATGYGEESKSVFEESKTVFAYNDKGQVTEETWSNGAGSIQRTYKYEYDARGNWTRRETHVVRSPAPDITGDLTRDNRVEVTRRTITYY